MDIKKIYISSRKSARRMATTKFSNFNCGDCDSDFITIASLDTPFCPNCGSQNSGCVEEKANKKETASLLKAKSSELACLKCPDCQNHLIMEMASIESKDGIGKMHCVNCGTEVSFTMNDKSEKAINDSKETKTVVASLNDLVKGIYTFKRVDNKVLAYVDIVPVAKLDDADSLPTGYVEALNSQALEDEAFELPNDFTLFDVAVPVDDFVDSQIQERLGELEQQYKQEIEQIADRYKQSVAIVLAGSPKGLFDSADLYEPFIQAMENNGVSSNLIEAIITDVASSGTEFASCLHNQALEVMAKSDDARNQLAEIASLDTVKASSNKAELAKTLAKPLKTVTKSKQEVASLDKSIVKQLAKQSPLFR